jgi:hypothetical protein
LRQAEAKREEDELAEKIRIEQEGALTTTQQRLITISQM